MAPASRPRPDHLQLFIAVLRGLGAPAPVREHVFAPPRRFRFDLAWPERLLAIEVEGGIWSRSPRARAAHSMPLGILRDMEKGNLAVDLGWRVYRFTPDQLLDAAPAIANLLTK